MGSPQAGTAVSATKQLPRIAAVRHGGKRTRKTAFDAPVFFESAGAAGKIVEVPRKSIIFAQGVPAKTVVYLQQGGVKLSVVNEAGKEAVVAMLGPGDFFGEGCIAGQPIRIGTASAITQATVLVIEKDEMIRLLQSEREFSDRFISYLLARNVRIEADLVDQLFNSTEKRLARALLLLARCKNEDLTQKVLPKISQETLAETIGTTRSRVNLFMNKFKKMGFIKYNGGLQIDSSLLTAVLHQ
ncbi:MAG: Crp/Fnr family transcriptional regulator [Candidatus Sulfotelmatobacter sp.]